jgi:dynein heavy chain
MYETTLMYTNSQVAKALPVLCVKFHEDVQALSARFLSEQRRHYYVTPTSYLELLGSYKKLLAKRQDEVRRFVVVGRWAAWNIVISTG